MNRVTITKEDEKDTRLRFEKTDAKGSIELIFERTDTGHPDLDKVEPLWVCAEFEERDISMFLTRKDIALLRSFIDEVLKETE
jgi:hypothetical protein